MNYARNHALRRFERSLRLGILFLLLICPVEIFSRFGVTRQSREWSATQSKKVNIVDPSQQARKHRGKTQKDKKKTDTPNEKSIHTGVSERESKKQKALSLIEGVFLSTEKITPIEYKILTEVETATLLWPFDQDRAYSVLESAIKAIRQLLDEKKEDTLIEYPRHSKERQLMFLALRKLAAFKPELLQKLIPGSLSDGERIKGIWTEESRAIISVAAEQIEKDPKLAARLAEQTFPLGLVSWEDFLSILSRRDKTEAERLAFKVIDRIRDSSLNPIVLRNLIRFILAPDRPPSLKEHYFGSIIVRLQRDFRRDISLRDLEDSLSVAREMGRVTAEHAPHLQTEFDRIRLGFELLFREKSLPLPDAPRRITIDVSAIDPAKPGETQEIADSLTQTDAMKDLKVRDREYQKQAVSAAAKADINLAEEILSRINDESIRRETTVRMYSPVVRKAISESAWPQAQKHASKILDPLGQALAFDQIAQAMLHSKQDRQTIIDAYFTAIDKLEGEKPSERVAKGLLLVSRPLYQLDKERGLDAIKSFIYVLNKTTAGEPTLEESPVATAGLSIWVSHRHARMPDDVLNLSDMVTSTFQEIASHDVDKAMDISLGIKHRGIFALTQLAISRVLLDEARRLPAPTRRPR